MLRPMIILALGIAILGVHTRFTCFETDTPIRPTLVQQLDVILKKRPPHYGTYGGTVGA